MLDGSEIAAGEELPEINGYRLLRVINRGGMSTVYLARQHALGRDVAIKVMSPQALADEVSRRRFENEVRTIARLEHPHVVRIHEVGRTTDGLPYYAMPYMARGHLGQRDYNKSESRVAEIALTLLSVLAYAHARNIVHRDVKAENVLFDDADRPLLADFGIALRKDWGGARMTAAGLAVGSTAYMAPEQARGEVVDGRADLYALGVLMWEMLVGKLPYEAADALSMAVMHAQDPVPKLPAQLAHWQGFMNRALAKQPGQRFEDAAQMRAAIESVMQRSLLPALRDRLKRLTPLLRQYAKPISAVIALLAFIGVGVLVAEHLSGTRTPRPEPGSTAVDVSAHNDVTEAMLKPLPESPARRAVETARQRIAAGRLTSPVNANAYTSVLEAWNADSTNAEVFDVVAELTKAFAETIATHLRKGNDARAREIHAMATALGQQTGTAGSPAYKGLQAKIEAAIKARFEDAARRYDRAAAQRTAQLVADFGLPPQMGADLARRAQALPRVGATLPDGSVLQESKTVAIDSSPVSRGEYARFTKASGHVAALCRERVSLLRVIAPRDWRSPGFYQSESEPVVCVSLLDAEAYAYWYSRKTGQRWRLPTLAEARQTAAVTSGRDVSLWSRDCGSHCSRRKASGKSWRSSQSQRTLVANRGYDDVGFRLVRDL